MNIIIETELSALGIKKAINPLLPKAIEQIELLPNYQELKDGKVIDFGCGQLRNVKELRKHFSNIYCVDTKLQISKKHNFYGNMLTIPEFVKKEFKDDGIKIVDTETISKSNMCASLIFLINVMDVVTKKSRTEIFQSIKKNLSKKGYLIVIVPRNDSHTLKLCSEDRKYEDGFLFPNRKSFTFYRNWTNKELEETFTKYNLKIVKNLSNYKYGCYFCKL